MNQTSSISMSPYFLGQPVCRWIIFNYFFTKGAYSPHTSGVASFHKKSFVISPIYDVNICLSAATIIIRKQKERKKM